MSGGTAVPIQLTAAGGLHGGPGGEEVNYSDWFQGLQELMEQEPPQTSECIRHSAPVLLVARNSAAQEDQSLQRSPPTPPSTALLPLRLIFRVPFVILCLLVVSLCLII